MKEAPENVVAFGVTLHNAQQDILDILEKVKMEGEALADEYKEVPNCDIDFVRQAVSRAETSAYGLGVAHSKLGRIVTKVLGCNSVTDEAFQAAGARGPRR